MNENINKKMISIVVPAMNEGENVNPFYEKVTDVFKDSNYDFEMIVIYDESRDDTLEKLQKLNSNDERVKIIELSRNFGKEIAVTAGLDYAKGDAVVVIDMDLQDPPELIKEMITKWEQGYNMVYATRVKRDGENWLTKFTASWFYKIMHSISIVNIPKNTGDFRLMDRRVLTALSEVRESHRFMKGIFSYVGYKSYSLKYHRDARNAGETNFNYKRLVNFAIEGITSFSIIPLRLASYFGIMLFIFSFLWGAYLVVSSSADTLTLILFAIIFLGSIMLIAIGILGEYVGKIYHQVKNRPLYFVKNLEGIETIEPKE